MANSDDTSKPPRSRRKQSKASAASTGDAPPSVAPTAASTPPSPPLTLEQAIENERIMLLQIRAMLHCLYEVLLYADDDDTIMHADVANTAARLLNESCARLDSVNLQPLIDALRKRGSEEPREEEPDLTGQRPYQVREPMTVYLA
jgi:hypothetical protein